MSVIPGTPRNLTLKQRRSAIEATAIARNEDDVLVPEVSDEVVEAASQGLKGIAYAATVAFCSGLDTCPA